MVGCIFSVFICIIFLQLTLLSAVKTSESIEHQLPELERIRHVDGVRKHLTGLLKFGGGGASALGNLNVPKHGLNETCNNSLCEMLESALSCKALGFHLSKICAQYLLGFLYDCPIFPPPSDLLYAPSVCLTELTALLPAGVLQVENPNDSVVLGIDGVSSVDGKEIEHTFHASLGSLDALGGGLDPSTFKFTNIKKYLASNFTENCHRRCFQRYIAQSDNFYTQCSDELLQFVNKTDNTNAMYPLVYITENYQEFRNQVCAYNENGTNCFSEVQQFMPDPENPKPVNIFQYDCNYFNDTGLNSYVLDQVCETFNTTGCCFGNQAAMLLQSQTNQSALTDHHALHMFQPCLMRYLTTTCGYTDPYNFCTDGANGNMTTIRGSVVMGERTDVRNNPPKMPNVYDVDDVATLQGVLAYGILWDNDSPTKQAAMNVEITNYAYFNSTIANQGPATQLTPESGELYDHPFGGDFTSAHSARYDFQIVFQDKNKAESDALLDDFVNKQACSTGGDSNSLLQLAYAGANAACVDVVSEPGLFVAEPIMLSPNSAPRASHVSAISLSLALVATTVLLAAGVV
jgi:hypothetical protein